MAYFDLIIFEEKIWLLVLLIVLGIYLFACNTQKKRKNSAMSFSEIETAKSVFGYSQKSKRNKILLHFTFLGLCLITLGLSHPMLDLGDGGANLNLVFSIDASYTMDNFEGDATRYELAKNFTKQLINELNSRDLVGVVDFASSSFSRACLTSSHEQLITQIDRTLEKPRYEYAFIGDGLLAAVSLIESIPNKNKVIVILSDGTNAQVPIEKKESKKITEFVKSKRIKVFSVGIGSDIIPIYTKHSEGRANPPEYLKLNKEFLEDVGRETGGDYLEYSGGDLSQEIKEKIYRGLEEYKVRVDLGNYFIIISFAILLMITLYRYSVDPLIQ